MPEILKVYFAIMKLASVLFAVMFVASFAFSVAFFFAKLLLGF